MDKGVEKNYVDISVGKVWSWTSWDQVWKFALQTRWPGLLSGQSQIGQLPRQFRLSLD